MFENLNNRIPDSLATAHGGLIRMPSALAATLDTEVPKDSRIALDLWFKLPRDQQVPPWPVAMYRLSDDVLTVAIIDEYAQTLHSVVEGSPEELPRFAATIVRLSREAPDGLLKVPGGGPGDTPGVRATR